MLCSPPKKSSPKRDLSKWASNSWKQSWPSCDRLQKSPKFFTFLCIHERHAVALHQLCACPSSGVPKPPLLGLWTLVALLLELHLLSLHPPTPSVENLSSMKLVPGAKKCWGLLHWPSWQPAAPRMWECKQSHPHEPAGCGRQGEPRRAWLRLISKWCITLHS